MRALAIGAASSMAARHGHVGTARSALAQLTPDELARLPRDHYWWAAVWLVAEACFACGDGSRARALYTAAVPFRSLFCVDPVCLFLGSMEHHLGLLAYASGDQTRAVAHLDIARDAHRRLGCARWAELTDRARDAVARR
jgi:hypothetical protein